ncbi:acyltransferase family protein [Luteimonas sp. B3_2_R+30]|uniref:Acyltransferase family protein n=2 Tax=Luteimonas salinilitoris TaxID=3237697 RepID=A0ABV4HQL2_9GAMM
MDGRAFADASGYRRDIDGMRALAVLGVLLFHIDPRLLPGGFAGVDVFFVISGFLITSILARQIRERRFSFSGFYLRRIRRIAPAYFAVTLATLAAGVFLLQAEDLRPLGRSALWSVLSVPNVYFWLSLDSGYFAPDSRQVPLLHLWSLGVEEQFYLVWPALLLLGLRRLGQRTVAVLLVPLILWSFHYAHLKSISDPAFAYYMLPARAGELGLGALLALLPKARRSTGKGGIGDEALAAAGLGLILASYALLGGDTRFPGWTAFWPCLGAALLILAGGRRQCAVMAPLRWTPVVWIGLISYSLYLWHWPVLAFTRYFYNSITPALGASAIVMIMVLSVASHYLIERPARHSRMPAGAQFALLFLLPVLVLVPVSWLPARYSRDVAAFVDGSVYGNTRESLRVHTAAAYEYEGNCQLSEYDPEVLRRPACVHGAPQAGTPQVLLWGDSHAAHHIGVVGTIAEHAGLGVRNASYSTCPPVRSEGAEYGMPQFREGCARFREQMQAAADGYATVVLAAQWSVHFRNRGFGADLERTIDELLARGKQVVLLGQAPAFPAYDRACETRNLRLKVVDCVSLAMRPDRGVGEANRRLQRLTDTREGVHYLDIHDALCRDGVCSPYLDGRPVYFDTTHLSMDGSWLIGRKLVAAGWALPAPFRRVDAAAAASAAPNPPHRTKP